MALVEVLAVILGEAQLEGRELLGKEMQVEQHLAQEVLVVVVQVLLVLLELAQNERVLVEMAALAQQAA